MRILLILAFGAFLGAQTLGTITKTTTTTVTAVAGGVTCVFTSQTPALPTGVSVQCTGGGASYHSSGTVPVGNASGLVGDFTASGDSVTWILTQASGQPIQYQIAANGKMDTGTL